MGFDGVSTVREPTLAFSCSISMAAQSRCLESMYPPLDDNLEVICNRGDV